MIIMMEHNKGRMRSSQRLSTSIIDCFELLNANKRTERSDTDDI